MIRKPGYCFVFTLLSAVVVNGQREPIDLSELGNNTWARFRPGWSLTVNDQCLYQFEFVFEHDIRLPIGSANFDGDCTLADDNRDPVTYEDDGKLFLEGRRHWERFPDYVWATIGFNHLSIDWFACGHRPKGYAAPHYDFSFFRTTPEFRVHTMGTCKLQPDPSFNVPGERVCAFNQDSPEGMGFWIVPGAFGNREPVVNMPRKFDRPESGNGAIPTLGLRSWDQSREAEFPQQWKDVQLYMSTYQGDLVMWQAHVPFSMVSGPQDQFTSDTAQYHETTISTLPDTYAFHYNTTNKRTTFTMLGKAQLCREPFERAEAAYGGPPIFPVYPRDESVEEEEGNNGNGNDNGNGNGNVNSAGNGGDSQDYYSGDQSGKSGGVGSRTTTAEGVSFLSSIIMLVVANRWL